MNQNVSDLSVIEIEAKAKEIKNEPNSIRSKNYDEVDYSDAIRPM